MFSHFLNIIFPFVFIGHNRVMNELLNWRGGRALAAKVPQEIDSLLLAYLNVGQLTF
jgi:hypothetical protein